MRLVWASQDIDSKHVIPECTTSDHDLMGPDATRPGAWASGPEDYAPSEYPWSYKRVMTAALSAACRRL